MTSLATPPVVDADDLDALAAGCAVLSTGGGGAVAAEVERVRTALRRHGPVPLVTVDDLDPDALVLPLSVIGAPEVGAEDLVGGHEAALIRDRVEVEFGAPVAAVMCTEIGGGNGVAPFGWAAGLGLPMLDADGMGRAFPELPMISMNVAGVPPTPAVFADTQGNVAVLRCPQPRWSERWGRALCVASGGTAVLADYVMTAAQARGAVIDGTVSLALELGAQWLARPSLDELVARLGARTLGRGPIVALDRAERDGFTRGRCVIDSVEIDIHNEYVGVTRAGRLIACAPDLIGIFDTATAAPIATEHLRRGAEVTVLSWPCHPLWTSAAGLRVAGPRAFGYEVDHPPR